MLAEPIDARLADREPMPSEREALAGIGNRAVALVGGHPLQLVAVLLAVGRIRSLHLFSLGFALLDPLAQALDGVRVVVVDRSA
jgi:hypothetical protein